MRLRAVFSLAFSAHLLAFVLASFQANGGQESPARETSTTRKEMASQKETLWLIPHTHWEGAVFKTREEYLEMGLPNILQALKLLKAHPEYRFVLDQVAYVKPFLERYPEEVPTFRKFVDEGRLQLVGAGTTMHDVNMPSGESYVRHVLHGKRYYRDKLGVDVSVGWALDTFGHHAQMPQLLKQAGFKSYWFFRGVPSLDTPSEFLWEGIDGTRVPAFWLPFGYALLYPAPGNIAEFDRFAKRRFELLTRFSGGSDRVAVSGADVSIPEEHLPQMLKEFNRKGDASFSIRFGVPTDFEAAVAKRGNRKVLTGELNPVFQGIYSSRIEIKQWMRNLERTLTTAEKLGALAQWLGFPVDHEGLVRAWDPVLFNQAHDLASGVMVDKVYEDTIRGFEFSKKAGDQASDTWFENVSSKIDTRGGGAPIVVFNSLGWPRTDVVEMNVGFSEAGVADVSLQDASGRAVPVQVLTAERYGDGGLKHARIIFVAHDVPAMGYSVYTVSPNRQGPSAGEVEIRSRGLWGDTSAGQQDRGSIENEYYRVTFNLWTGEMVSLRVKQGDWEALSGPANVVAREQDGGDFWELYGTLHGGRNIQMIKKHLPPRPGGAEFSSQWVGGNGSTNRGPVMSEYKVVHPFGQGNFGTTVRLYAGVPRVDIKTQILNNDEFVRYRALFPTSIKNGTRVDEIPFGALERPLGVELPAQNWIDYSDGKKGIALLNQGLPGNNVAEDTLLLSLMRSARITAYAYHGGFEPGVSSDSGLSVGKSLTLHYALAPHAGDWREAGIYRAGLEFNNPLIARKVAKHSGILPKRWGFLEVSHLNVVTSALKPGPDGSVILRVYEASGRATAGVKIKLNAKITSAHESNLIEDSGRKLRVENDSVQFDLGPYEIKTIKFQLHPLESEK